MNRRWLISGLVVLLLGWGVWSQVSSSTFETPPSVNVLNFPPVQAITGGVDVRGGKIQVDGPIRQSEFFSFHETVTQVPRSNVLHLVDAGVIDTRAHAEFVVTVNGRVNSKNVGKPGHVGAILLPEIDSVIEARTSDNQLQFALDTFADIPKGRVGWFAGGSERYTAAFSRYHLLLYNDTDSAVALNVYVNLIN